MPAPVNANAPIAPVAPVTAPNLQATKAAHPQRTFKLTRKQNQRMKTKLSSNIFQVSEALQNNAAKMRLAKKRKGEANKDKAQPETKKKSHDAPAAKSGQSSANFDQHMPTAVAESDQILPTAAAASTECQSQTEKTVMSVSEDEGSMTYPINNNPAGDGNPGLTSQEHAPALLHDEAAHTLPPCNDPGKGAVIARHEPFYVDHLKAVPKDTPNAHDNLPSNTHSGPVFPPFPAML